MTLNLVIPASESQLTPKITVIGVGGAGGNAVNNMIQSNLEGVNFLVANTDAQALSQSLCEQTIQIGRQITQGLGAGSQPDVGRAAAEESLDEMLAALEGVNMVFIAAGMGGGTGTGAAPVIARATREAGILTVGVTTKPFQFEGIHRMKIAETGLSDLQQYVDTLIIIPNQNLFRVANEKTTFADAFKMADDVLHAGVRGVTDLIVMPGLINLDFADIRAVMGEMGKAMMGTGEADGENRAIEAAEAAISNPLLDEVSMKGARGVLINITGGDDLTLFEVDEAANRIRDEVDPDANIIFGSTFEQAMSGHMRVSVVATGIEAEEGVQPRPVSLSLVSEKGRPLPAEAPDDMPEETVAEAADMEPEEASEVGLEDASEPAEAEAMPEPVTAMQAAPNIEGEEDDDDSFFAPPPAASDPAADAEHAVEAAAADPFAEAEIANSGQRHLPRQEEPGDLPSRRRAQGLLAKVTGAARAFHEATQTASQLEQAQGASTPDAVGLAAAQPGRTPPGRTAEPERGAAVATAEAQTAKPESRAAPESASKANQPRLTGLDPAERLGVSPSDEDLLDIPAFLRRQAN
jgi:cell division protein FtsZ